MKILYFFLYIAVHTVPSNGLDLLGINVVKPPPNDTIVNVNLKPVADPVVGLLSGSGGSATTTKPTVKPTTVPKVGTRISDEGTCGKQKVIHTGLIVNGQPTKPGDWPWHVALFRLRTSGSDRQYICGGTLLSETRIVTAGHCVVENHQPILPERLYATMGKYNLAGGDMGSQERSIFEIVLHPEFDSYTLENDIAILKLTSQVKFSNYIQPICLWDKSNIEKSKVINKVGTVVGWGFTQENNPVTELMKAKIPIQDDVVCFRKQALFYSKYLTEKTFCAGYANGTSPCNGDSGGGLYLPDNNDRWFIRGIVSVSVAKKEDSKCDPNYYPVFTDVAAYLDFVESNMNKVNYL